MPSWPTRVFLYEPGSLNYRKILGQAFPLLGRNLADFRRILGDDHPDTLTVRSNLAFAYLEAGELSRAIPLFERILCDRQRALGDDHPDTLAAREILAAALRRSRPPRYGS